MGRGGEGGLWAGRDMPGPEGGVAPRPVIPYTPPMELAWLVCLPRPYWPPPCSTVSPELVLAFLVRP